MCVIYIYIINALNTLLCVNKRFFCKLLVRINPLTALGLFLRIRTVMSVFMSIILALHCESEIIYDSASKLNIHSYHNKKHFSLHLWILDSKIMFDNSQMSLDAQFE